MASEDQINALKEIAREIRSIDMDRLMRPNLGDASLASTLHPKWEELEIKLSFATDYVAKIHDSHASPVHDIFTTICSELRHLADLSDNAQYISHSQDFLNNFDAQLDSLRMHWPPFVTTAVEARGFLEDEGVKTAHDKAIEEMKSQAAEVLGEIREESEKTIAEARKLAEQIENRARSTAARISVKDAQNQFQEAQGGFDKQVRTWSILSAVFVTGFVCVTILLWFQDVPPELGSAIYHTSIRLTLLGALGAMATFSLRVLRAHLHMRQRNLHRQRVANSIAAFVESAVTPEQRDLILSQLVESVAAFGTSGLVQDRDDHVAPSRLAIDSVMRSFSHPDPK